MRFKRATGFTLVEAVAALAVVSIALLGLLRLHLISITAAEKARSTAAAVLLARGRTTEALCSGYPSVGVQSGETEMDGSRLTWRTEVSDVRSSRANLKSLPLRGLRKVSVDVTWGPAARQRHMHMMTYVAESKFDER